MNDFNSPTTKLPIKLGSSQRRLLLKALVASGLIASITRQQALAQSATDYKALVCIYL